MRCISTRTGQGVEVGRAVGLAQAAKVVESNTKYSETILTGTTPPTPIIEAFLIPTLEIT